MSLLSLRDVTFAFPGWPPTVQGVDLDVEAGAFHCLVGRSGCGKTTLLKLAAGLLRPGSGGTPAAALAAPGGPMTSRPAQKRARR